MSWSHCREVNARGEVQRSPALITLSSSLSSGVMQELCGAIGAMGEPQPMTMTLGQALAAPVRLIVWYKSCWHRAEPDVPDQAGRYGERTTVISWASRLTCSDLRWARGVSSSVVRRDSLGAGALSRPLS